MTDTSIKHPHYEPIGSRIPERLLLGPGPSNSPPTVLEASALPLLGHLDPRFSELLDEIQAMLRQAFQTENPVTYPVSGTGTAGMECLVMNLFEPGDKVVVGTNGVFGDRICQALRKIGAEPIAVETAWGEPVALDAVAEALKNAEAAALWLVHAETSTGVLQPNIARFASLAHDHGALMLLDCVTSLGGAEVRVDDWGVDAAFSGTQKCLNVTPGLAPVTLNARALGRVTARKSPVPSWYLDINLVTGYWEKKEGKRVYHHTAPIASLYALHEGLRLLLADGLEARWLRHQSHAEALEAGLTTLGFKYRAKRDHRLPMLHSVMTPAWMRAEDRAVLLEEFNVEVGGSLGPWSADTWRIGLMGCNARQDVVIRLLTALDKIAVARGAKPGGKVAAERKYVG